MLFDVRRGRGRKSIDPRHVDRSPLRTAMVIIESSKLERCHSSGSDDY